MFITELIGLIGKDSESVWIKRRASPENLPSAFVLGPPAKGLSCSGLKEDGITT